jgi:hypothetical protein
MRAIRVVIAIAVITQLPASLPGQAGDALATYRVRNVPPWALKALGAQFQTQYEWYDRVNPFYQRGDFDGDGKADVALLIRHKVSRKVGIAFVHQATGAVHIVGAGTALGNGGDDFAWLGAWRLEEGPALAKVPGFHGEVLYVEKPESAGGLIYWDGRSYQWVQWGD